MFLYLRKKNKKNAITIQHVIMLSSEKKTFNYLKRRLPKVVMLPLMSFCSKPTIL